MKNIDQEIFLVDVDEESWALRGDVIKMTKRSKYASFSITVGLGGVSWLFGVLKEASKFLQEEGKYCVPQGNDHKGWGSFLNMLDELLRSGNSSGNRTVDTRAIVSPVDCMESSSLFRKWKCAVICEKGSIFIPWRWITSINEQIKIEVELNPFQVDKVVCFCKNKDLAMNMANLSFKANKENIDGEQESEETMGAEDKEKTHSKDYKLSIIEATSYLYNMIDNFEVFVEFKQGRQVDDGSKVFEKFNSFVF
ncbi:unnamed protein product [Ilex paraguariensis]|uniref:Uncharacterized protein n=1 Tax=Ilex paraguariensis TaxID=185542 RepID=A0ABC8RCS2_9AQUA